VFELCVSACAYRRLLVVRFPCFGNDNGASAPLTRVVIKLIVASYWSFIEVLKDGVMAASVSLLCNSNIMNNQAKRSIYRCSAYTLFIWIYAWPQLGAVSAWCPL